VIWNECSANGTPWDHVFASDAGEWRDIPHKLIKAQLAEIASKLGS
jgi:hypothetical protein